jgi:hypothetical protein
VNLIALRVENVVIAVLLGDTLGTLLESLHSRVGPPLGEATLVVILTTRIVKGMGQFVGGNTSECCHPHVQRPGVRVERGRHEAARKDDFSVRRGLKKWSVANPGNNQLEYIQ